MAGVVALAALLCQGAAPARAQQIKGRVMVLVDTSGSMVGHFASDASCGGDGDANSRYTDVNQSNKAYYPGYTLRGGGYDGPNSRLYGAKSALTNVINASGDIEFGLMRYAAGVVSRNHCHNASHCCDFASPGCVSYGGYSQNGGRLNWEGSCGNKFQGVVIDGGQLLVTPSPVSAAGILPRVDGVEDFRDNGQGYPRNPELRANGPTPLAGSVRTALGWYQAIQKHSPPRCSPNIDPDCDPQIDCRPYALVLMTDGADTCDDDGLLQVPPPNTVTQAVTDLHNANKGNPVLTYVVGLALVKNDPVAVKVLDAMAKNGGTTAARYATDQASIEAALADIAAASVKVEVCNNKDDNCNGLIDEGFDKGAKCAVGVGACLRSGIKKCDPMNNSQTACCVDDGNPSGACVLLTAGAPRQEVCNGLDDDCNGIIDDPPVCEKPRCFPEVCNGLDDDCDGVVDNNLIDVGRACGLNIGQCKPGLTVCQNAQHQDVTARGVVADGSDALVCVGAIPPSAEVCDGLDNDCDGVVDGLSRACYDGPKGTDGVGPCHQGAQACIAVPGSGVAAWGGCVGQALPGKELCNGIDDDCNGQVDDVVGLNSPCCPSGRCGVGVCTAGAMECSGGQLACSGGQGPRAEVCNGIDDDCDGKVDDLPNIGALCLADNGCPGALRCDLGKMAEVCVPRQQSCTPGPCNDPRVGQPCGSGVGLPAPCAPGVWACENGQLECRGGTGPRTEVCNCVDDDCNGKIDDGATCPGATACIACACLAACGGGEFPCPGGFDCLRPACASDSDCPLGNHCSFGQCGPGYCAPNTTCDPPCAAPMVCRNQRCVDPCAGVNCAAGSLCVRGNCERHDCTTNPEMCKACQGGAGQYCDTAQRPPACAPDPCCGATCSADQVCDPAGGGCLDTCRAVRCPAGDVCAGGKCLPPCGADCPAGQFCDPRSGTCALPDAACVGIACSGGQVCCHGACGEDPCARGLCAPGYRCRALPDCGTVCEGVPSSELDTLSSGGGGGLGLGCSLSGGGRGGRPAAAWLLLLPLAALWRRRRRGTLAPAASGCGRARQVAALRVPRETV